MILTTPRRFAPLYAVAMLAISPPTRAEAPATITLTYYAAAVGAGAPEPAPADRPLRLLAVAAADGPLGPETPPVGRVQPLRHPFKAIATLNRDGADVFKQPGALPYLVLGVAALASDRQTVKWFNVPEEGEKKSKFSSTFSTIGSGEVIVPAILLMYVAGHGRERDTAKLWGAAILNATLWTQGLKMIAGKERPNDADGRIVYHGPGTLKYDSFPSGHTSAATASAIVLGHQYPRYKSLLYAVAAGVGIARIQGRNHWPSDVYWGAGVGYYSGWQAIRNEDSILRWEF
jgi:undecaprenyl-diphosphatase